MKPMTIKKRRNYFYILLVIFLVLIPIIMFYTSGYRIKNFKLVETGGIYIYSPVSGSIIYLNNKKKKNTNILRKDLFIQNLKPNTYNILVAKDGYWPWAKEVNVEEKHVSEAIAFLVPKEPDGEVIPKTIKEYPKDGNATGTPKITSNPIYDNVIKLFTNKKGVSSATKDNTASSTTIRSGRNRVELWKEEDTIFIKWLKDEKSLPNYFCKNNSCENTVSVFKSTSEIKNFNFYPGREDVVLLSINEGVYAIEVDSRKHQNFQPVYKGSDPYFVIEKGKFYIKDGENIFKINL
jgi:hypothetical protein